MQSPRVSLDKRTIEKRERKDESRKVESTVKRRRVQGIEVKIKQSCILRNESEPICRDTEERVITRTRKRRVEAKGIRNT